MATRINRKRLAAFIQRRKINALGLLVITVACALITLLCAVTGFAHTDVLLLVTAAMIVLCLLHAFKNRKGFRTIRSLKGLRRKKKAE